MYSSAVKERKKRIIKFHSDGIHFSFRKYKAVLGIAEQAMIWLVENNNSKPLCPVRQTGGGLWVHFPNSGWYYQALLASQSSHIENCTVNQNCQARSVYSYCVAKSFCRLAICFVLQEIFFCDLIAQIGFSYWESMFVILIMSLYLMHIFKQNYGVCILCKTSQTDCLSFPLDYKHEQAWFLTCIFE